MITNRWRRRRAWVGAVIFAAGGLVGCGGDAPSGAEGPATEALSPTEHLLRASMALRGVRPSLEELRAVQENPDYLPAIVDYYLDTPEFGATIREMHAEQLLVGVDPAIYPAGFPPIGDLAGMDVMSINRSVVEAPLRLIEHVVMNDRSYHQVVTADYTLADPVTSTIFGIPYEAGDEEWQETRYDDGRAHAGVLSDSFLFTRHSSTVSNRNRGRAAFVARTFLCYDFLDREVEIDSTIDLADEEAVANAIENNPACVSCHQTLDPLASHFAEYFPIYVPSMIEQYPFDFMANPYGGFLRVTDPGFFGEPSTNVRDLGILIAADPRFSLCTARRFYSYLAQVPQEEVDLEIVSRLSDEFLLSAMSAKALAREVVLSPEFARARALTDEGAEEVRGLLKARPEALARTVENLTGYRWTTDLPIDLGGYGIIGEVDLMTESFFGFGVLGGGTDSQSVTRPSYTMNASSLLVLRSLAAHAAPYVVQGDLAVADADTRWLLRRVEDSTRDEETIRAQLVDLHLRLYGETHPPDSPAIDDAWTLFSAALAEPDATPESAWELTLYALLQDIRIAYY